MTAYVYLKKPPKEKRQAKTFVLSSLFLGGGIFLLTLVIWPILTFELLFAPKFTANIVSPIPEEQVLGTQTDLTQASN
ncbi:hypothetical protein HZB97_03235, partial [Candidatus Gottesmanbacteria bacterium]|nr:hypothetical protein [Candidatus Gottesmanbacteria bacterium]